MNSSKFAAILAAFFMSAFVPSDLVAEETGPGHECRPASYFVTNLSTAEKVAAHLIGAQAGRFMEVYNAVPPRTALPADEILILTKDGVPNVAVLRFVAGCFQDYGVHPRKFAVWLLRNSVGQSL